MAITKNALFCRELSWLRRRLRCSLCPTCVARAPDAALLGTARSRRGIVAFTHLAREGRMTVTIGRRELLAALGSAAAAWPLAARAQQQAMPVIGYLSSRSPDETAHLVAAFRRGLGENGFVEGQNVTIEYRWALGQYDRLPAMALELVRHPVTVLTTTGGEPSAFAAKSATSTIPIVFTTGDDPVKQGLVAS